MINNITKNEKPNSATLWATTLISLKRMILSLTDAKTQWFESHHVLQIKRAKITITLVWKTTGEKQLLGAAGPTFKSNHIY